MDTRNHLQANIVAGALTSTHLTIRTLMPLLLGVLAESYALPEGKLGDLGGAYSAGATLAALTSVIWMRGLRMRLPAAVLMVLGVGAFAAIIWTRAYAGMLALFVLAGIGHGGVFALMIALLARTEDPNRSYGWQWCLGSVPGVVLLYAVPVLSTPANAPMVSIGLIVAVNALIALTILRLPVRLPDLPPRLTGDPTRRLAAAPSWPVGLALLAIFTTYSGGTGCWAFLGRIATGAGLGGQYSGVVLALATAVSSLVSLLAGEIGNRAARPVSMGGAVAGMLLGLWLLACGPGEVGYGAGAIVTIALLGFVLPFLIGIVSRLDVTGRAAGLPAAALGLGAIAGPSIAGHVYQAAGPAAMLLVSAASLVVGLAAYLAVYGRAFGKRRADA